MVKRWLGVLVILVKVWSALHILMLFVRLTFVGTALQGFIMDWRRSLEVVVSIIQM